MPGVLIIRSAPVEHLQLVIDEFTRKRRDLAILTSPLPDEVVSALPHQTLLIEAPAGPLSWQRLSLEVQARLQGLRPEGLVILHNGGDDRTYFQVFRLAAHIAPEAEVTIDYADGRRLHVPRAALLMKVTGIRLIAGGLLEAAGFLAMLPFSIAAGALSRLRR